MGVEDPRSFSAVIAAKHAEFISYREAISKLAEYTGDSLEHVAMALKQEQLHAHHAACLSGPERAVHKVTGSSETLAVLLDITIRTGQIAVVMDYPWEGETADPDSEGWMRSALSSALTKCELPCPEALGVPSAVPALPLAQFPTYADVVARLCAIDVERDRLAQQLAELSGDGADHDNLREQVAALTAKVTELSGSLDAANTRIQELSGDQAQGKTRTAMLQVIGAMAKDAYRVDIHAQRMSGFGEMLAAIQAAGADVKEDALRGYLKEAATLLVKADIR